MARPIFKSLPVLNTQRLRLRALGEQDTIALSALWSDPNVNRYLQRSPVWSPEAALDFIQKTRRAAEENEYLYWGISPQEYDMLIGTCYLVNFDDEEREVEIGYELSTEWQGKGLMREAVGAVLDHGFKVMKLDSVYAYAQKDNEASKALLKHFDFIIDRSRVDEENPENRVWVLTRM